MSIEVPPEELHRLAGTLRGAAEGAHELAERLSGSPAVGRPLQGAVDDLLECHRTAATALAGEFGWLAATVSGVADSWLRLDDSMLAPLGGATHR